jgi:hypothetical protein
MTKYRTNAAEQALLVEGLAAGFRENLRLSQDARRLGYHPQADGLARKASEFQQAYGLATSVSIEGITVKHS